MDNNDSARPVRIQLNPVIAPPADSSQRGPKRSISKPSSGERNVWQTIRMEKVTCKLGRDTPSCAVSGRVNKVHRYWGLEATIAHMTPHSSCHQRLFSA